MYLQQQDNQLQSPISRLLSQHVLVAGHVPQDSDSECRFARRKHSGEYSGDRELWVRDGRRWTPEMSGAQWNCKAPTMRATAVNPVNRCAAGALIHVVYTWGKRASISCSFIGACGLAAGRGTIVGKGVFPSPRQSQRRVSPETLTNLLSSWCGDEFSRDEGGGLDAVYHTNFY